MSDSATMLARDGFMAAMGMRIVSATSDEVTVEWDVESKHYQPMGVVHGGVFAGAVETACSIGAGMAARARDPSMTAVGLDNHTSFVRAVRSGTLRCVARPVTRGSRTQVWHAEVTDADGRVVATGSLRLLCVSRDEKLGERARG